MGMAAPCAVIGLVLFAAVVEALFIFCRCSLEVERRSEDLNTLNDSMQGAALFATHSEN
jgi:hypothetical protein